MTFSCGEKLMEERDFNYSIEDVKTTHLRLWTTLVTSIDWENCRDLNEISESLRDRFSRRLHFHSSHLLPSI